MKIYLDLLPQEKKNELKREKLFQQILREGIRFLLPLVVFIVILANIYYVLLVQRDASISTESVNQSQEKYRQLTNYEDSFSKVNDTVALISKIKNSHLHWEKLFQQLSSAVPDTITIKNISTKNFQVFLIGKAKTRDDLIGFKRGLENNSCFQNINVPLSDLVVKNDVEFQLDLSITQDCLTK